MSSRERILERLKNSAPVTSGLDLPVLEDREIFEDYPSSTEEMVARFQQRFVALKGEFFRATGIPAAADILQGVIQSAGEGPIVAQSHPLVDELLGTLPQLQDRLESTAVLQGDSPSFSRCALGISAADCLVARTASIVVRSSNSGGRRLSVLPPIHVVLARLSQMVFSLEDALGSVTADPASSYVGIINGPSRTADIEKILVMGAHGPKRLAVILVD